MTLKHLPFTRWSRTACVGLGVTALALGGALPAAQAKVTAQAATPITTQFQALLDGDLSSHQWSLQATHADLALTRATGSGVTVGVVDTGIDRTRPDLTGRVLDGAYLDPAEEEIVPGYERDSYSHGTHVAGIIAGDDDGSGITGVAPDATLLPVNLETGAEWGGQEIADGVTWAAEHGAQVINLSLGVSDLQLYQSDVEPMCTAIEAAIADGVVVVAAAGNDGDYGSIPSAPATCDGVISVAALDHDLKATSWSSYDGTVTVAAPGADVLSTVPTTADPSGFAEYSGTSMATPFVVGVVALLLEEHPDWTPAQVKAQLVATASDAGPTGTDPVYGAGVVDPARALGVTSARPTAVPFLKAYAYPFVSSVDAVDYDETLLTWRPDTSAVATGYTVDVYTTSGVQTYEYDEGELHAELPYAAAGFVVTAHTNAGDLTSAPIWSDPHFTDDFEQVKAPTRVTATRTASGGLIVEWKLPAADLELADLGYVELSGGDNTFSSCDFTVTQTTGHCTFASGAVPQGDLSVTVSVYSRDVYGWAYKTVTKAAAKPFWGTYQKAGLKRVTVTLNLAPSWAAKACKNGRCNGVRVKVKSGKNPAVTGYLTSSNTLVVTLKATPRTGTVHGVRTKYVTVRTTPVKGHKKLTQASFKVPVS